MSLHAPDGEAGVAEAVRAARAAGEAVEIRGGGTRLGLGRPVQAARALSLENHAGVTLYEPGALTLVARAGAPVAEIETLLAAEGQRLAFEPMDHRALLGSEGEPTLGGVVACAVSGPRRAQVGACKDFLLGMRFVTGEGEIVKSGGRVMKNVTGYDLAKLLCGAFGTLGVITEVALKVLPAPETAATLRIDGLDDGRAIAALTDALGSPFEVSGAAHAPAGAEGPAATMIRLEGFEASVGYRVGRLRDRLAPFGDIAVETDRDRLAALWRRVRDVEGFAARPGAVWRCAVKPGSAAAMVAGLRESGAIEAALYDWGGGLVWLLAPENADAGAAPIRAAAEAAGGRATLVRASAATRAAIPPFHPRDPRLLAIEARLRARFDPDSVLNPGRMAA